jgi:tetratricopeptide (TPR) repeat protein
VFAPLAEAYRKLGMLEEALKILKEGIKRHPTYVLGYLVLAQCYFDQKKIELAYQVLHPLVKANRDNLSLQKLFAQICYDLGNHEEALDTYKYLLFMSPRDAFYAQQVKVLEDDLIERKKIKPKTVVKKFPETHSHFSTDEDDWSMVSFESHSLAPDNSETEAWSVEKPGEVKQRVASNEDDWTVMSRSIDDEFFTDDEISPEDSDLPQDSGITPVISNTLVDLYLAQNQKEAAIHLLQTIIERDPGDITSRERLRNLMDQETAVGSEEIESHGHDEIIRIIQHKVHAPEAEKMERALRLFLQHIQLTADEKLSQYK